MCVFNFNERRAGIGEIHENWRKGIEEGMGRRSDSPNMEGHFVLGHVASVLDFEDGQSKILWGG